MPLLPISRRRALRLRPNKNLQLLLGADSLASIASWADSVRKERDESYDWHFVDIPKDAAGFSEERDCFRPQDKHKDASLIITTAWWTGSRCFKKY